MKPRADAFTPGDAVQPPRVAHGVDRSSHSGDPGGGRVEPIRVTRDDTEPGAVSAVSVDFGETAGRKAFGEWWSGPVRATRDDVTAEAAALGDRFVATGTSSSERTVPPGSNFGFGGGGSSGDEEAMTGPGAATAIRGEAVSDSFAGGLEPTQDAAVSVSARAVEEVPAPGERRPDDAPHLAMSALPPDGGDRDGHASGPRELRPRPARLDAGEPRSPARQAFDPRTLPRRTGAGRTVTIVLALLAVAGVVAGGGYFVWKSALVRPALVRHLPPVPVPGMTLIPVHAANAAVNVAADAADDAVGAAHRTDERSAVPVPESVEAPAGRSVRSARGAAVESRSNPVVHARSPEDAIRDHAVLSAGASISDGPVESRTTPAVGTGESGRVQRIPPPAREPRSTGPASPAFSLEPPDRVRPAGHDDPAASRPPAPAVGAAPGAIDSPDRGTARTGTGPRSEAGAGIMIRRHERTDRVAASLRRAHDALLAGDDTSAAEAYRAVLGHEPGNRDARLGLAAVAARAGRWDEAAGHYTRILASDPADTVARAALIAIHEEDPARGESGLKALLRSEPEAAHLHFILGNLYAAQSRWPEARHSYFDAYRFDRDNADYAYNLAVSLDHLSRPASALGRYREAFDLSRTRPASFEDAAVRRRIRDLESLAEASSTPARSTGEAAVAAPIR